MTIYDIEHLPRKVLKTNGIYDVLQAIDPELTQLRADIVVLLNDLYINTTTSLIDRWEDDFGIAHDTSLTIEERRAQIISKLLTKNTLTWENLYKLILSNLPDNNKSYYVINDSANYSFTVVVQIDDYEALYNAIMQAKPAYITFQIIVSKYSRRCGTFVCGTNPI